VDALKGSTVQCTLHRTGVVTDCVGGRPRL
jgi:hypothetical protein